jgi:beta-glucanase (GH16 family)
MSLVSPRALSFVGTIALLLAIAFGPFAEPAPARGRGVKRPAVATGGACGGALIEKSKGKYWRCTFADEFNGGGLDSSKWLPQRTDYSGYTNGATACFVDSPDNISVSNGGLNLTARKEAAPFSCRDPYGNFPTQFTSGMVTTYSKFAQAFGRFEVRARVSALGSGLQTSFWLWPEDVSRYGGWPTSGEIDIAELFSNYPDRAIPYIHYSPGAPDPYVTNNRCLIRNPGAFHTYAVEWTKRSIKVIYDGRTCLVNRWVPASPLVRPGPFNQPFMVSLTQALGVGPNAFDPATTPLPATTTVDYVRVWR